VVLDYISDKISRKQFFEKVYAKSRSSSSIETAKAHLTNLDHFSNDVYGRNTDTILGDLREDMLQTHSPTKVLRYLDEFVKWMQQDHPNIILTKGRNNSIKYHIRKKNKNSIAPYFATVRKYLSQVGGIRLHDDDIKMDVTKPKTVSGDYENEDAEPLTAEQARNVIELTKDQKSITLYHTMNDTGFRISEAGQIQEKHIDFQKNPVEVILPQNNSKGKSAGGTRFVRRETAKRLKHLCNGSQDRFIFKLHDSQSILQFRHNELARIRKTYGLLGMIERYEDTDRHKFNLHSWRKRCATEYARKNGEALAHGYIRHRKYLGMYIVKSKEEKASYFQRAVIDLAIDEIEKAKHTIDSKDQELLDIKKSQKKSAREAVLGVINEMTSEQLSILVQKSSTNRHNLK
jgi:integrase